MVKASDTSGVKPMSIAGRLVNERERLLGMSDAERAFRKQWLKDQELAPNEPRIVPEMYKATFNPIRRFYRWPLDQFQNMLTPKFGPDAAYVTRYLTGKTLMAIGLLYLGTYYFKYNTNSWIRKGGWRIMHSKIAVFEGDPDYPKLSDRSVGADYASRGFNKNTLNL